MLITKSYNKRENYAGQKAREVDLNCEVCNKTRISFTVYEVDGWRNKITSQLECQYCKSKNGIPGLLSSFDKHRRKRVGREWKEMI